MEKKAHKGYFIMDKIKDSGKLSESMRQRFLVAFIWGIESERKMFLVSKQALLESAGRRDVHKVLSLIEKKKVFKETTAT